MIGIPAPAPRRRSWPGSKPCARSLRLLVALLVSVVAASASQAQDVLVFAAASLQTALDALVARPSA